jgi:pimeloyl-ACP methyl ester carboxylesterase
MVEPRDEQQIRLRDGRSLGYAEYGLAQGPPVFYFHGFPGSRLDWSLTDPGDAAASRVRLIAPDRPGYGLSDASRGRTMLDWASDVEALADGLGIERFAVLGTSGGGPFALACASAMQDRVTRCGVVCGMGPASAPGAKDGVSWVLPGKPAPLRKVVIALMAMGVRKDPDRFVEQSKDSFAQVDAELFDDPTVPEAYVSGMTEAFRTGTGGANAEARLYPRDWGFSLEAIGTPVDLWHGTLDENVPISVGRSVAEELPDCQARFLEGEGHLTLPRNHVGSILDALVADPQAS